MTTPFFLDRDSIQIEVALEATVKPALIVGRGQEQRTEPAEVTDIQAYTLDGRSIELTCEEEDRAREEIASLPRF